ncbi:unnamed protein product [Amoebophrya sp. A25]|nr:unnamed protein product [Amoebophrya sp. A25]|eukprot:GSA25T00013273001.1
MEQRVVEAIQKYRFVDESACAPTVAKDMLCAETWAGVSLIEEQEEVCDAQQPASTRNLKRAAASSLGVALRMMVSSTKAGEWMGVRGTTSSRATTSAGDRRPVVVVNEGLLHLLTVLHTGYMQERFPRFEFHVFFDAATGLLFLWNSLQTGFPDRVAQHGAADAEKMARKAEAKSRIDDRFAEHVVERGREAMKGGNVSDQDGSSFSTSLRKMNFGNDTELRNYPCSLFRIETLDQFFPVFAPRAAHDPSFLVFGCSPMLFVPGRATATGATAAPTAASSTTSRSASKVKDHKKARCFLQCRRANPRTRAAHASGWTDKKAVSKMFYDGSVYRLYAKLACGGSGAAAFGFHDEAGKVESLLRIDSLDEYRQTFSYSLNHDLAQGGEALGGIFAWLLDNVSAKVPNTCVTVVKDDLRGATAALAGTKGKAQGKAGGRKGAGKASGGAGDGYASEVRLRFANARLGVDYSEEMLAKINEFCEKWREAEEL